MQRNKFWSVTGLCILMLFCWTTTAFSRPVVKVSTSKNAEEIKKRAKLFLEHLDVHEKIHIIIAESSNMPKPMLGITMPLSLQHPKNKHTYMVLLHEGLDDTMQMRVLAHEMIHVKQYAKEELIVHEKGITWKGRKYHYVRSKNLKTPWEQEAYRTQRHLVNLVEAIETPYDESLTGNVSTVFPH